MKTCYVLIFGTGEYEDYVRTVLSVFLDPQVAQDTCDSINQLINQATNRRNVNRRKDEQGNTFIQTEKYGRLTLIDDIGDCEIVEAQLEE